VSSCYNCALIIAVAIFAASIISSLSISALAANDADDKLIMQYCSEHEADIFNGKNSVNDLVKNGTVQPSYQDKTCSEVRHTYQEAKSTNPIPNKLKSNKELRQ